MTYILPEEQQFSEVVADEIISKDLKTMNTKFDFLYSNRFWALIIGAVSIYLQAKGIIGDAEMMLISTITAGFIVVKTVDRNTGDAVEKSSVTTVSIPSGVSNVSASTDNKGNTGSSY